METSDKAQKVWANAWGGASSGDAPLIGTKIKALRRKVGALESKRASNGPSFPVKSSKELFMKLQPALDELNLYITPIDLAITTIDPNNVPPTDKGKVVRSACTVKGTYRLVAEDGSYAEFCGAGGGLDADDKAIGKATTYAYKDAVLKFLCVPEKDMIDTDDEEDVGSVPVKKDADGSAFLFVKVKQAIDGATNLVELAAAAKRAKELPHAEQMELSKLYLQRKAELS